MKFNFQSNKIATVFPFAILLIFLRIDLILLNTLPTGGDMGAHIVPTKFFVEELFIILKLAVGQMTGLQATQHIISIFHYRHRLLQF